MGYSKHLFTTAFLLLVLVMATARGMGPILCGDKGNEKGPISRGVAAEAIRRTCESPSSRFKGTCIRHSNCGVVCQTEGFQGGKCGGFLRRCFCTKPC